MSKINFKTKVIVLELIISLFFFNSSVILGQEDSTVIKKIDSTHLKHFFSKDASRDTIYHRLLNQSKKINYFKGEYKALVDLMIYHGTKRKKDSFDLYSKKLDSLSLKTKQWGLKYHYLTNKGLIFTLYFNNIDELISCYLEAHKLIPDEEKHINKKVHAEIQIASGYLQKKLYERGIKIIESRIKDSLHISRKTKFDMYSYLGQAYRSKNEIDQCNAYLNKALKFVENESQKVYLKNTIALNYSFQGNRQKAIDSLLAVRKVIGEKYRYEYLGTNSHYLALVYYDIKNIDKAIFYIKKAIEINLETNYNSIADKYDLLSRYYEEKGNLKLSLEAAKKANKIKDSLKIKGQKIIANYYDKELNEAKIANMNPSTKLNKAKLTLWISSIVFLCFIGWLLFYYQYLKSKNGKTTVTLTSQNRHKENEFSSVLHPLDKKMSSFVNQDKEVPNITQPETPEDFLKLEKNVEDVKKILNLDPKEVLSRKLEDSEYVFFITSLKKMYPDLSDTDIKHCFFIYSGMSLKQTAQLLHVSVNTVKNARYRAKTRIDPPEDISFKIYLDEINKLQRISS